MCSPLTPKPERSFVPGPALADGAALLAWLEALRPLRRRPLEGILVHHRLDARDRTAVAGRRASRR